MDISSLIMAAEYLEKREKEAEHGYALSGPAPVNARRTKSRSHKAKLARSTHNELEKNRRAHLRYCFEELRQVVPVSGNSSRHTTLGLLKRARLVIKELEEGHRQKLSHRKELLQEQQHLVHQQKLFESVSFSYRGGHTLSECSVGSSASSVESSGYSERDSGVSSPSDEDEAYDKNAQCDYGLTAVLRL